MTQSANKNSLPFKESSFEQIKGSKEAYIYTASTGQHAEISRAKVLTTEMYKKKSFI